MTNGHLDVYEGWNLDTLWQEERGSDWSPGKPIMYSLSGYAELVRADVYRPGFRSTKRINVPDGTQLLFADYKEGHQHIKKLLKAEIDRLKNPE